MKNVIIIAGPTASGKTALSIDLAKKINGEIISADSMQVYKYMNIGTAKPTIEEMEGIPHYLIDELYPDEEFSVAKFKEKALFYINKVLEKGKVPIVAGGTGLYINSLVYNIDFTETICDWELREKLANEALEKGNEYVYNILREIDPEGAGKLHVNDIKRVIRAIEVFNYTKKPISYHQKQSRLVPPEHNYIIFGLKVDRQKLYDRINKRVDIMIKKGLIDEVKGILDRGYPEESIAMQGIGYKEIISFLKDEISLEFAVDMIKQGSRRYAKRQITWFKKTENLNWIDMDQFENNEDIIKNIKYYIATSGIIL